MLPRLSATSQAIVENLLKEYPNVLTLRVRMPIVESVLYPRNFITKVRSRLVTPHRVNTYMLVPMSWHDGRVSVCTWQAPLTPTPSHSISVVYDMLA